MVLGKSFALIFLVSLHKYLIKALSALFPANDNESDEDAKQPTSDSQAQALLATTVN